VIILDEKNNDIEQLEVETPHEFVVRDKLREKRKNIKTFEDYFNVTVDRKIDTKYIKANKNKMAKTKEKQAE
jgi:hypothetical protein